MHPKIILASETFEKEEANPFATGFDRNITVGVDGKIGVTKHSHIKGKVIDLEFDVLSTS